MVIQHVFSKNSCMRIKLLVSVNFHHSDFYLCSISSVHLLLNKASFITPASIYAVLFSSLHLLNKASFITPASIYAVLFSSLHLLLNKASFITPASIYTVLFSSPQLLFIQNSFPLTTIRTKSRNYFENENGNKPSRTEIGIEIISEQKLLHY